jgi:dUTP pyrophosphatase
MGKKSKANHKAIKVRIAQLPHAKGLPLPAYQTAHASGFDLVAAVPANTPHVLKPGQHGLVPTGLVFEIPAGMEIQVRPRSGLALKHGVTVLNSPGTIDSDYRGEVQVILINLGTAAFEIVRGERIAQAILAPIVHAKLRLKSKLSETARGAGGFGSTGVASKSAAPASAKPRRVAKKSPIAKKAP